MKLSHRLETIASFVRRGSKIADIGTDHGYVPIRLVQDGIAVSALAMDVRSGPLERAAAHVREAGLKEQIQVRQSDGLLGLRAGEADCVIIAGMGGELILHILEAGRERWAGVAQWILSPHSEQDRVRRYLLEQGFSIVREAMVEEDGKYYTILDAAGPRNAVLRRPEGAQTEPDEASPAVLSEASAPAAASPAVSSEASSPASAATPANSAAVPKAPPDSWSEADYFYGKYLIARADPILAAYLEKEKRELISIIRSLAGQEPGTERTKKRLVELKHALARTEEAQHEMQRDHKLA